MNIEDLIKKISPKWAAERARYRSMTALYEAAIPNRTRRTRHLDRGDANFSTQYANEQMVSMAREMVQNYDVIRGVLDIFASKIIGKCLQTQPMVRDSSGKLHDLNHEIKRLYSSWINTPEISGLSGGKLQRMAIQTWIRDGEFFTHFLEGYDHPHRGAIPFSVEMIETDQVPYFSELREDGNQVIQGIEFNSYHQPTAYLIETTIQGRIERRVIPASEIAHVKLTERFGQVRGVTRFASIFIRAENLQDYEWFEQIQAKAGAATGLQITRDKDMPYDMSYSPDISERQIDFKPGMVFDDLLPGERVESVGLNRPNPQLEGYRAGQLRMMSRGIGIPPSSFSGEYEGSYSSRRQEMVDFYLQLETIADEFIWQFWHPIYERFIKVLILYDFLKVPPDVDMTTITEAIHAIPSQPWIDPQKEAAAKEILLHLGLDSRTSMIRQTGRIPEEVDAEIAADRARAAELGLNFDTPTQNQTQTPNEPVDEPVNEEDGQ